MPCSCVPATQPACKHPVICRCHRCQCPCANALAPMPLRRCICHLSPWACRCSRMESASLNLRPDEGDEASWRHGTFRCAARIQALLLCPLLLLKDTYCMILTVCMRCGSCPAACHNRCRRVRISQAPLRAGAALQDGRCLPHHAHPSQLHCSCGRASSAPGGRGRSPRHASCCLRAIAPKGDCAKAGAGGGRGLL